RPVGPAYCRDVAHYRVSRASAVRLNLPGHLQPHLSRRVQHQRHGLVRWPLDPGPADNDHPDARVAHPAHVLAYDRGVAAAVRPELGVVVARQVFGWSVSEALPLNPVAINF